jgi:hypothetical protein
LADVAAVWSGLTFEKEVGGAGSKQSNRMNAV